MKKVLGSDNKDNTDSKLKKYYKDFIKPIKESLSIKGIVESAGKVISANSIKVDPELRNMQIGMGLNSNQAMALSGAMSTLEISKEDLAYLTQGQRDALGQISDTLENAYATTDMSAISEMGNSLFMIKALITTLQQTIAVKLQELMTSIQPILDAIQVLLTQVIDEVIKLFDSPEFQNIITLLSEVIGGLVNELLPIIQSILPLLSGFIIQILGMFGPLIQALIPVLFAIMTDIVPAIINLVSNIMPIIIVILDFVVQIILPIITNLMPVIANFIQFIGTILQAVMPIITPILEFIGSMLETILPPVYKIFAMIYNAVVKVYNKLVGDKKHLDTISTKIKVDTDSTFKMPKMEPVVSVTTPDPVANSYSGYNNVTSTSNTNKLITVDANFNSNISGGAAAYGNELMRVNYDSGEILSSIIEGGT